MGSASSRKSCLSVVRGWFGNDQMRAACCSATNRRSEPSAGYARATGRSNRRFGNATLVASRGNVVSRLARPATGAGWAMAATGGNPSSVRSIEEVTTRKAAVALRPGEFEKKAMLVAALSCLRGRSAMPVDRAWSAGSMQAAARRPSRGRIVLDCHRDGQYFFFSINAVCDRLGKVKASSRIP